MSLSQLQHLTSSLSTSPPNKTLQFAPNLSLSAAPTKGGRLTRRYIALYIQAMLGEF